MRIAASHRIIGQINENHVTCLADSNKWYNIISIIIWTFYILKSQEKIEIKSLRKAILSHLKK